MAAADAQAVVLAFLREDASGAPLAPSPVVDALERAGVAVEAVEPGSGRPSGVDVALRVSRERQREAFFLDPLRRRSDVVADLAPTATAVRILASATGGAGRSLAVTGLERFARCAFMGYAPTGASLDIEGCDVVTVIDGLITHNDAYFDATGQTGNPGFTLYTPGMVQSKVVKNAGNYNAGFRTVDSSWINYATKNQNASMGWAGTSSGSSSA